MYFKNLVTRLIPSVKASDEGEIMDPMIKLKEKCRKTAHAKELYIKLEKCNERVTSKSQTTETCVEELMDFIHEVDHCVSKDLFKYLK